MWQLTLVALAGAPPGGLPDAGGGGGAGPRQDDRVPGAGEQVGQVTHLVLQHLRSVPLLRGRQPAGAAGTPGRLLAPPGHPWFKVWQEVLETTVTEVRTLWLLERLLGQQTQDFPS